MRRLEITAIFPLGCFICFIFEVLSVPERRENIGSYVLAGALLAAPLLMLCGAHLTSANSWKRRLSLIIGDVTFLFLADVGSFILAWFKPGWLGVVTLSAGLVICCAIFPISVCRSHQKIW